MLGIDLDASYMSSCGREPDGGVAAKRADFEDVFGVDELGLYGEVLALQSGDGNGRDVILLGAGDSIVQVLARSEEGFMRKGVDGAGVMEVVGGVGHGRYWSSGGALVLFGWVIVSISGISDPERHSRLIT